MDSTIWRLYKVEHPLRTFIGVAQDLETAIQHFGQRSKITLIQRPEEILQMRLNGPERVLIAL